MRRLFSLIFFTVMLCAPFQGAHAQKAYIPLYKQYNEAIAAGDFATAADAGERAWRAAEADLGDHQTTAILAYNYAALVYFTMPEKAIEPLERVVALTGESNELFGAEPPGLMLNYVRAATDSENRTLKSQLRRQLTNFETEDTEQTLLSARGWLHIARYDMSRKKYGDASKSAEAALRHYEPFRGFIPREFINALMASGISKIAGNRRTNRDIVESVFDLNEAIAMFPAQSDIESFDPLLAAALAWENAARVAARSDIPEEPPTGSRLSRQVPILTGIDAVRWTTPRPNYEECGYTWKSRRAPRFPDEDAEKGYLGAVLLGYHFDGTKVADARILAEVPQQSEFAEVTLKAIKTWELDNSPPVNGCHRNMLTTIRFSLR